MNVLPARIPSVRKAKKIESRIKMENVADHTSDDSQELQEQIRALSDAGLVRLLTEERDACRPAVLALLEEEADQRGGLDPLVQQVTVHETQALEEVDDAYYDLSPLASRGSRLLAVMLDGLIFIVTILLGVFLLFPFGVIIGLLALMITQGYLLTTEGQTLGKRLMNIRIVRDEDESNPGFWHAVVLRYIVPGLLGLLPFFELADILFIFRDDYRCIHDHIAGTKVIED